MSKKENFLNLSNWEKVEIPEQPRGNSWNTQMSEAWMYKGKMTFVVQKREFSCTLGTMNHITIKKISEENLMKRKIFDSVEPDYEEKILIRQVVGEEKRDMLEVFPRESSLVDAVNLYHFWILPNDYQFPFPIEYPTERTYEESGYFYHIEFGVKEIQTEYGKVVILSIKSKDGERIPWKSKQEIKDDLIGNEETAIELIPKGVKSMKDDECYIIGMPHRFHLPFGLSEEKERLC